MRFDSVAVGAVGGFDSRNARGHWYVSGNVVQPCQQQFIKAFGVGMGDL